MNIFRLMSLVKTKIMYVSLYNILYVYASVLRMGICILHMYRCMSESVQNTFLPVK